LTYKIILVQLINSFKFVSYVRLR